LLIKSINTFIKWQDIFQILCKNLVIGMARPSSFIISLANFPPVSEVLQFYQLSDFCEASPVVNLSDFKTGVNKKLGLKLNPSFFQSAF